MNDTVRFAAFRLPADGAFQAYVIGNADKGLDS